MSLKDILGEYPGRFIILGRDTNADEHDVVVYGITGRSESSQARTIECDEINKVMFTKPTNPEVLAKGIQNLLIYSAIMETDEGIAVSNGYQTNWIYSFMKNYGNNITPTQALEASLKSDFFVYDTETKKFLNVTSYEPDEPNFTPRISGCIKKGSGAFHIVRKEDGEFNRYFWPVKLKKGEGRSISTYTGVNENPLPSFKGLPLEVKILGETPTEIAESVYKALAPEEGKKDFRVSVAVLMKSIKTGESCYNIINRHEKGE